MFNNKTVICSHIYKGKLHQIKHILRRNSATSSILLPFIAFDLRLKISRLPYRFNH